MKQVENTAKKWTNKAVAIVVVIIILGAADSLLLCLSILRERKKEREKERERSKRSQSPLFAALFLPSVKKVPTKEIKIGSQTSLFSLGLDTLNVFCPSDCVKG